MNYASKAEGTVGNVLTKLGWSVSERNTDVFLASHLVGVHLMILTSE